MPEHCVLEGQFGFCPPDTAATARAQLQACVHDTFRQDEWCQTHPPTVEFFGYSTDPYTGIADNSVILGLQSISRRLWNQEIRSSHVTGCCDLRHFRAAGSASTIPSCLYGPGGGKNAHAADEYVILDHVVQVAKSVGVFALEWSGAHDV